MLYTYTSGTLHKQAITSPRYFPDMKTIGVQQAETRVINRVRHFEDQRLAAIASGRPALARKFACRRQGAEEALEGIHELLRNYQGLE